MLLKFQLPIVFYDIRNEFIILFLNNIDFLYEQLEIRSSNKFHNNSSRETRDLPVFIAYLNYLVHI